ncbi:DASS family sodium-coupled anion symporter [Escherichia coli]|nr:DASS family sodium-coupled anion symporter [Escherichia coli]ELW6990004.1 DASS family sodium-coupled anion symporter [Escherichia coli]ELW7059992.1 DASS family sodium-coupled anion symporter [Escherichia coli]ELW7104900.1 DASS family sodium-coupled anion symporter [Escherichia coli]ELW7130528.1 DASS family sodium-coupled anion symporter [Escherichia coli]
MKKIPCVMMRGGTSRGAFLLAEHLPEDQTQRDKILMAIMGSGNDLEIDGIGGGNPLTSKVAIISRSSDPRADVDYLFAQVIVHEQRVDTTPNCGNMLSGVGAFAIENGLIAATSPVTRVRIRNVNTGTFIEADVQTPNGVVEYEGSARIDGVPGTTWLVFSAFTLSAAFVTTGLGKRIAYLLIGKIGNTTLGLGYVTVFLDLVLAPATPSNTARAGGIVLPIINSVAVALGSEPEKSPRRVGHYLMMSIYMVTKTTSYMFFTAMAGNILALKMINDILHLQISWGGWALAAGLPGIIMLLVTPLVIYTMYPPEIKKVDNKTIAKAGLAELGPMKIREKMLLGVFVLALLGWIFSKSLGVDESTVAIVVMATMLLLGIVTWEDVVKNKGGWNTLIWYGGIIGLSSLLSKVKFFEWLAEVFKNNLAFDGHGNVAFFVIIFLSIIVRYFFASGSAYIVAMLPVFAMLANVSGAPLMLTALALLFSNSYGGMVTHYGGAAGPVIFGVGYNDIKSWWLVGAVLTILTFLVHITLGVWWWNMLIGWNML